MTGAEGAVGRLNALPADAASAELRACCGASRWTDGMVARRPYPSVDAVLDAADEVWRGVDPDDWLEAFAHHPRLGESVAAAAQDERARDWSAREQGSLGDAAAELRVALAAANAAYERRFGYICIICATGKDPEELLAITRARLSNAPEVELRVAAEEQRKITRLRLRKLFHT
jgi:OHCU decarboxylase